MFSPLTFLQLFPPLAFKQLFSCSQFCVHAAWTRIFATFIFFWLLLLMLLMLAKLLWQEVSTLHAWVITQPWSSFFSGFFKHFLEGILATSFVFPLHFWVNSWSKSNFGSEAFFFDPLFGWSVGRSRDPISGFPGNRTTAIGHKLIWSRYQLVLSKQTIFF